MNIRDRKLLDEAEADYVTYRLKEIAMNLLSGNYDYMHLLQMHKYIFQDIYEWAGQQRKLNIYKEEAVLGGLSVDYSEMFDIPKDSERVLSEMRPHHPISEKPENTGFFIFSRGIKGYKPRISPFTQITVLLPIWKDRSRHRFPTGGLMKSVRILRSSRGNADLSVLR